MCHPVQLHWTIYSYIDCRVPFVHLPCRNEYSSGSIYVVYICPESRNRDVQSGGYNYFINFNMFSSNMRSDKLCWKLFTHNDRHVRDAGVQPACSDSNRYVYMEYDHSYKLWRFCMPTINVNSFSIRSMSSATGL